MGEAKAVVDLLEQYVTNGLVPASEIAVMYRRSAQSRSFEKACMWKSLPCVVVGSQRFYNRQEARLNDDGDGGFRTEPKRSIRALCMALVSH